MLDIHCMRTVILSFYIKIKESHFKCYVKMADQLNLISVPFHQVHAKIYCDDRKYVIQDMRGDLI